MAHACSEHVDGVQPNVRQETYDFMLNHLQGLVKTAREVHGWWKQWVPPDVQRDMQSHLKGLELHTPKLVSRKADFLHARTKEDTE